MASAQPPHTTTPPPDRGQPPGKGLKPFLLSAAATSLVGAVIITLLALVSGRFPFDDEPEPRPTVPASNPPQLSAPSGAGGAPTPAPTSPGPAEYELVFENRSLTLALPPGRAVTAIDFDAPATARHTEKAWTSLAAAAKESGTRLAAEFTYRNPARGGLTLLPGRTAAQLKPAASPLDAAACAHRAKTSTFKTTKMSVRPPLGTVFCLTTDQGNTAMAEITRYTPAHAARRPGNAPTKIEFRVTLWHPTAP
ncbi:hypothetical protein EDD29_2541 [Actinocorallia herbida]|uniref:Uncharacterized protein n=1 Tax=Actinocorallia herbida TaxID=58109 RepID=A0A3N1CUR0_9ACTN|nr:hypothetical protein [Actinocorallia herbida]ROO85007.1 hypothetical protein EDD29_2541 [Actinocorallia herbida]